MSVIIAISCFQTFDPLEEIVVKTDFAAGADLKAKHTATCENPTRSNQCVAIVLHSPGPLKLGEDREVVTDYWRIWSNAKPSYRFHQLVMEKITKHYKNSILPGLKVVNIQSDGCG